MASNIDDTFILILLFSSLNFHARHVIIGQFLGIGVLITVSTLGSLIALVVPPFVIGLMGLIPIVIGIKRLVEYQEQEQEQERLTNRDKKEPIQKNKRRGYLPFLTVGAITVSNGGDDIGVFTPLFAKYNTATEVSTLIAILMSLTVLWCMITHYFVNHPMIATRIQRIGNIVTPFVLIGLELYILIDAFFI